MNFEKCLTNYADLIVSHGLNVQKNQIVNISVEACHRDFALLVAEAAYRKGASYVNLDLIEPRLSKLRLRYSTIEQMQYVPAEIAAKYNEIVDCEGANLKIIGSEQPDILANEDPEKINAGSIARYGAVKRFYTEGINKSRVAWTVAAAATPAWGQRVFKKLSREKAEKRLWEEIFKICRVDSNDYLEIWHEHDQMLKKRANRLNALNPKEVVFKGPDTALSVGLSEYARFKGGSDMSPEGVAFEPNLPTEEIFTTPDYRTVNGKVATTRPFLINGTLIKGLTLEFKDGNIVNFNALEGAETFKEYISSDAGAKRLGEVALVGIDSPIYQSGHVFEEILFDENATCHIAIGSGLAFCFEDYENMSEEKMKEIGFNQSSKHTDMMISNENVDVFITTREGKEVQVICSGAWVEF